MHWFAKHLRMQRSPFYCLMEGVAQSGSNRYEYRDSLLCWLQVTRRLFTGGNSLYRCETNFLRLNPIPSGASSTVEIRSADFC